MKIQLVRSENEYISQVIDLGDKNANTLGHLPRQAYQEYAKGEGLICAIKDGTVAGYILLRQNKGNNLIKIAHLCVREDFRAQGLSDRLLSYVKARFKKDYQGIALNCRRDYDKASKVWERNGFYPVKEKEGRGKERNVLLQWFHDFCNDDLFSNAKDDKLAVVVDANIVIRLRDSEKIDETSSDPVKYLFSDIIENEVKYYYANESLIEIARDSNNLRRNQTRSVLSKFHKLSVNQHTFEEVYSDLCKRYPPSSSNNDRSDRKQIAEAIANNISVFVTVDKDLTSSLKGIEEHYDIQLFDPTQFIIHFDVLKNVNAYLPRNLGAIDTYIKKPQEDDINLIGRVFHRPSDGKLGLFHDKIKELISRPSSTTKIIKQGEKYVGLIIYDFTDNSIRLDIARFSNTVNQYILFNQIINELIGEAVKANLSYLDISTSTLDEEEKRLLEDIYFIDVGSVFRKFICNKAVKWSEVRTDVTQG